MTWQGPGLPQQAVPCPGVNESRAGPGQGGQPSPLPCFPLTPQEIDEYITQARDKSYETMMRVGKRGLNLAANAAVTAAAKVRRGQTPAPGAPPVHLVPLIGSCFHPVLRAVRVWGLCSRGSNPRSTTRQLSDFHSPSHRSLLCPKEKGGPSLSVPP